MNAYTDKNFSLYPHLFMGKCVGGGGGGVGDPTASSPLLNYLNSCKSLYLMKDHDMAI